MNMTIDKSVRDKSARDKVCRRTRVGVGTRFTWMTAGLLLIVLAKFGICEAGASPANSTPPEGSRPATVLPPANQVLYENDYFSVQTSGKVTVTEESVKAGEIDLTVIGGGPCREVVVVLAHMVFHSEETLSLDDIQSAEGKFSLQGMIPKGMEVTHWEIVKVNGVNAVKYTITSGSDPAVLIYAYSWPHENQIFQLTVGGTRKMHAIISKVGDQTLTYLDACFDHYNFLNTLQMK